MRERLPSENKLKIPSIANCPPLPATPKTDQQEPIRAAANEVKMGGGPVNRCLIVKHNSVPLPEFLSHPAAMPLSRHSSQAADDDPDRDSREFLSNFLACSEVDLSDLQSRDNLEDFLLILSSREGTPAPSEGSWNFRKVAAVLAARTAFRRALRGSQPAAAGSGAAGGAAGGARTIHGGLPDESTAEAESDELSLEPLDESIMADWTDPNFDVMYPDMSLVMPLPRAISASLVAFPDVLPGDWIKTPVQATMKSAAAGKWGAVMKVIRLSLRTSGTQGAESEEIEQRRREELQEEVNWYKERLKFLQESWMDANQDVMQQQDVQGDAAAGLPHHDDDVTPQPAIPIATAKRSRPEIAGPGDIRRGPFEARSIASAQCKIWQQLEQQPQSQSILDVGAFCVALNELLPLAYTPGNNEWVLFSVEPEQSGGRNARKCMIYLTMQGVWGATGEVWKGKKKSSQAKDHYTNEIKITIQSSGKTTTNGCLDREMLLEAHECLAYAIKEAYARTPTTLRPAIAAQAVATLADPLYVASAHIQGGMDINISSLGKQMNLELLADFLNRCEGVQVNVPKEKHNSAHFSFIGVYVSVQRFNLARYASVSRSLLPKY